VEKEYFEVVEYTDPATGEVIEQNIKVTKYKTRGESRKYKPAIEEEEYDGEF
jgi:hypothetical protein